MSEEHHAYVLERADGELVVVGTYDDPPLPRPPGTTAAIHVTRDRATADGWRRSLTAGELPEQEPADPAAGPWA